MESLSAKGAEANLAQWVRHANQELHTKELVVTAGTNTTQTGADISIDSAKVHGIQNTPVSVGRIDCLPAVTVPKNSSPTLDAPAVLQNRPNLIAPPSDCSLAPKVGVAAEQMRGLSQRPSIANFIESSNLDDLAGVVGLTPRFIQRRSAPAGHQVVSDEVDAEMYEKAECDILNFEDLPPWLKSEKDEIKDEPWTRLNELSTFDMCGFGQFSASLAVGVYNKERKSTLRRQCLTERAMLWDQGVRVPIGTRIAHAAPTSQWGALSSEGIPEETLTVGDFTLWTQDAYGEYRPDSKKTRLEENKH